MGLPTKIRKKSTGFALWEQEPPFATPRKNRQNVFEGYELKKAELNQWSNTSEVCYFGGFSYQIDKIVSANSLIID
ncbi:MAG: hypothetical protein R2819_07920 [Allomuricauda sp.]